MIKFRNVLAVGFVLFFAICSVSAQAPPFEVGMMKKISIDGQAADWGDGGLQLNVLTPQENFSPSSKDFEVRCRLGWDQRGLLFLAQVNDDIHTENKRLRGLWRGDAIEFFMADKVGGKQRLQLLIAPGMDDRYPQVRIRLNNLSAQKVEGVQLIQPTIARTREADGFTLEALIPWALLDIKPQLGREIGLQIFFNDKDANGPRQQLIWYPGTKTYANSDEMHRVLLKEKSGLAINASATASLENFRWLKVKVIAAPQMSGKSVVLAIDDIPKLQGTLTTAGEYATKVLRYKLDSGQRLPQTVEVQFPDGTATCYVQAPDIPRLRAQRVMDATLTFEPSTVIGSSTLPACNFTKPLVMEEILGYYNIKIDYYNAEYQPVTLADKPGRYAAVIHISSEDGQTFTRYRTVYRMSEQVKPWMIQLKADIQIPEVYGIDPVVAKSAGQWVNSVFLWSFWDMAQSNSYNAILLSGLSEMKNVAATTVYNSPKTLDKQYWTTLERKLNGNDKVFTQPFRLPQKIETPATTLHAGKMSEAGMIENASEKIDAILTQWANDTNEAFIACVVRNGVIVHHKAYGMRDGQPMSTHTKSYMASLSKLVSGTVLMMMVDQKLIQLDTPIDRYLPEMQKAKFNKMPTMRNLYTHTVGFTGHRGENDPDLEHLIAEYAPFLNVGKKFEYDGMGLELGIQLMGQVSGQCYPLMVKNNLLDPLGCPDTDSQNASWKTYSTAMDMAKIGQMLLNGGAYGSYQFMSEKTRDAMLPIDISEITTDKSSKKYGIGTKWFTGDGLSDQCFGHGAASAATLRIDMKYNLVISMTRNKAGKNFNKYHPQFIQTVTDCMVNP